MPNYIRYRETGGCYFFTANLLRRKNNPLLVSQIDLLRESIRKVKLSYPFDIDAWVVLPDHMHCIWTLPEADDDFSMRWRLIKTHFAKGLPNTESLSGVSKARGERGIWQRRFWEHLIRDEKDYQRHMDYIHYNPVKHGYVDSVIDWPYSTFHKLVKAGVYQADWGGVNVEDINAGE